MSVNLKVKITGDTAAESSIKTYRFPLTISVNEACQQIRERLPDGGQDHMLFKPMQAPQAVVDGSKKKDKDKDKEKEQQESPMGTWLKPSHTLESYDLNSNDVVWFRKRHKVVKAKTADEATKSVIVDLAMPVKDVVAKIGAKFNLDKTEEYSLQFDGSEHWLLNGKPLTEQGDPEKVLVLKKRFFVTDSELDRNSPVQLHLAYIQGREMVISGMHPTTKEEASLFAALQAQVEHGTFNPHSHKPGFLELNRFLPPIYLKTKDIETGILHQWKGLGSMTMIDAKFKYHQLCMTLRTYGTTIFAVTINTAPKGKKPVPTPFKLGFTSTMVQKLSADCKTIIKQHPYEHLKGWKYSDFDVTLDFGEFEEEGPLNAQTTEGQEIASLISGYIDILVRINKSTIPDDTTEGQHAEVQNVGHARGRAAIGMTVSTESGGDGNSGLQQIADIHDLASFRQAFQSFVVPTLRELNADSAKTSLTYDQLTKQMGAHNSSIERLAREMESAARGHDKQALTDLSKQMALAVANLLQDARSAASGTTDEDAQQRLLDASRQILSALSRFTDALIAFEANPNTATQAALELAKANLDNAMLAVMAAMRGAPADDATGNILLELARNVLGAVQDLCKNAASDTNNETGVLLSCEGSHGTARQLVETAETLGRYAGDAGVRARFVEKIKLIKPASAAVMESVSKAGKPVTRVAADMKTVDASLREIEQMLELPNLDIDPKLLPYLRAAYIALDESGRIAAAPSNRDAVMDASKAIKKTVPVLITHAREAGEENAETTGERMLELARQIALTTKQLLVLTGPDVPPNLDAIREAAQTINEAVNGLVGDDALQMHKVALIDRSKRAGADTLRTGSAARAVAQQPGTTQQSRDQLLAAANAASLSVMHLLNSLRAAIGHEGDERVNVNNLADSASVFCPSAVREVIVPTRVGGGAQTSQVCTDAGRSVQQLLAETQAYRTVGRLADIEFATEAFRAAESVMYSTIFANEAGKLNPVGTRAEALERLPAASSKFGTSLKGIAQAVKAKQSFIEPLSELSQSTQAIMTAVRGLVSNSHFKHERGLLIDASRRLAIDINRLIDALKCAAVDENAEGVASEVAISIGGSVSALQRIVALAQQEGGALNLDSGDISGPQADAELEAKAEQALIEAKEECDATVTRLQDVSSKLPQDQDTRSQIKNAVVDSVKALVASTSSVVNSAVTAQNELVAALAVPSTRSMYSRDPALAEGLLDAAHHVVLAIKDLTSGLNADTIDTLSRQELATQAEAVSKSVEILAAAVRAGTKKGSAKGLIDAARAVSEATKALLEAAKMMEDAPEPAAEEDLDSFGIDAYTLQEIKVQMKIAELDRKLEKAKKRYQLLMQITPGKPTWNVV